MIGAISGDVIGSVHEGSRPKPKDFPLFVPRSRFTDDTVLTVAVAHAIREGEPFAASIRRWGRRYPNAGYGSWFRDWLHRDDAAPYNSFGNGSAMRVAAIGWAFDDVESVLREAAKSADVTCQGTVPAAAVAFLESAGFENSVRNAVSLGGDADTLACIAGALAEAHYGGVPAEIQGEVLRRLDEPLRAEVVAFARRYGVPLADPLGDATQMGVEPDDDASADGAAEPR